LIVPCDIASHFNVAQVTFKHPCCPCPNWAIFVYSLILDELTGLDVFLYNLASLHKFIWTEKNNVLVSVVKVE